MNKSWHKYEWVMAQIWISHCTNMDASYHRERITKRYGNCDVQGGGCDEGVMWHIWMSHGAHIWMSHGTHMNELWHKYEWVVSRRTHYWEMRQLWCARALILWVSHLTHMNESWGTCEWVMAHVWMSHVTQNSLLRDKATVMCEGADLTNESCHTYEWVMVHTWMSHGTHMNESCHTELITER